MAKKSGKSKRSKLSPSKKKAGAARRAAPARGGKRKAAGAKTAKRTAKAQRKAASKSSRPGKLKRAAKKAAAPAARRAKSLERPSRGIREGRDASRPRERPPRPARRAPKVGGTGREETLAQTPKPALRKGPTNPMPTNARPARPPEPGTLRSPRLERERKVLREIEEGVPTPPSSLDLDRNPSAARSGRQKLQDSQDDHNETSPVMTGGDVDADWEDAYAVGDEAPGGDNPTPDQDRVDDIGKALGVNYEDNEELKASDKITERDKHRWELDPASSEDYKDRD